jgi:flavin-dependent dehydrogenase
MRPAVQIEMPDGLVALGDSVMALNPVHGQGITVSMMGAELLSDVLAKRLAAKSSTSNPALALRGLAKVRQRAVTPSVLSRMLLSTEHRCNS